MMHQENITRIRASRACVRCSRRKVKCDALEWGIPCSRCRLDRVTDCKLTNSKRGTYSRSKHSSTGFSKHAAPTAPASGSTTQSRAPPPELHMSPQQNSTSPEQSLNDLQETELSLLDAAGTQNDVAHPAESNSLPSRQFEAGVSDATGRPNISEVAQTRTIPALPSTLASLFEKFLDNEGQSHEAAAERCGIVFFGHPSPLTFALEEFQKGAPSSFHDAGSEIAKNRSDGSSSNPHPSNVAPEELAFLEAKKCFEYPDADLLDSLVSACLHRFYPLYSILDKEDFFNLLQAKKLPWILLHAVCFIGATYCDQSVIHRAGFKGRWHARRKFYGKVKALFDIGYETNKITLLQTVIMLSFWGPQMRSHWSPCSWIGFGATIAVSLGLYNQKSNLLARMGPRHKGLVRRLWWTLVIRDTYCASLQGRPFRINIGECDAEVLNLADFTFDSGDSDQTCQLHAMYQIQLAKLSLILRKITHLRFPPTTISTVTQDLHPLLDQWKLELPSMLDWTRQASVAGVYSSSLKVLFHHQLILLYLPKPHEVGLPPGQPPAVNNASLKVWETAAHTIASSALTLMKNSMVGQMPHEVFAGFFIAGVVFYRQVQHSQDLLGQMSRAALDNCQMVLNEARDFWDPAHWGLKVFDFLLTVTDSFEESTGTEDSTRRTEEPVIAMITADSASVPQESDNVSKEIDAGFLQSIEFESPQHWHLNPNLNDFLLMSSYLTSTPEPW